MTNERAPVTAGEVMQLAVQFSDACFRANNHHGHDQSEYLALRVAVSALVAERDAMKAALTRIEKWHGEFPPTGEFWDAERTRPISYAVKHGSNGERDYMREVARAALKGKP